MPWRTGAREPSRPSRPQPSPVNSSSDWSLLPHYANHLRRLGGRLPDVTKHGGWGSGLGSGRARAGARIAPRGDLNPDPSVPPPRPAPAPPPAPPLSSPPHPLYAPLPGPRPLCSPPPPPPGPRPLPPGPSHRSREGTAGQAGLVGPAGGRTGRGYGRGARRVCAARRPRPAPGFQHRGQRRRHERAKPRSCGAHEGPRRHQALRGADPAGLGRAGPQAAVRGIRPHLRADGAEGPAHRPPQRCAGSAQPSPAQPCPNPIRAGPAQTPASTAVPTLALPRVSPTPVQYQSHFSPVSSPDHRTPNPEFSF